jgi:hypothetical protein
MISLISGGNRVAPPAQKIKSETGPKETADQALEAFIKTTFTGKEKISVNEFKGFLGTIQNWICSANDFDIESKKAAIGDVEENGGNIIGLMTKIASSNPAVAAILEERKTTAWIDEGIKNIGTTLKDVIEGYENLKHLTITDKILQMRLTDETSSEIANHLKKSPDLVKFTGTEYTEEEQKAVLYMIIEESVKKANAESSPEKKASVLSESLTQALAKNAFKFSEDFILNSATELENNVSLINSINLGLNDTKLIKSITGNFNDVEERLAGIPGGEQSLEKKWTELKNKLSPEEINQVKADTDKFIARLQELVETDEYKLGTEEGELKIKNEIEKFKNKYTVPENASAAEIKKAAQLKEANSTYFDLVTNKAAATHATKQGISNILNGSGLGDIVGSLVTAAGMFAVIKALTSGNRHMENGFGMQPHGGGGFMKKALGLVFMATVMNSTGLLTGSNDQESANNIASFGEKQEQKQEKSANNIVDFARKAAGNLLGV